ncbi:diacylglycerol kinase family protein [Neobacillus fumarioli]|uniref:diacylglycerol kinase family protein n=1 Tax=Neobacillus fumarioli TaxID=105229 RepID=UPI000831E6C1|nr:diacylglycerol kinase family protein [Neobacillus fumarioli]
MVSHDNRHRGPFWKAFSFAIAGILSAIKTERNLRFHLVCSCLVLFLSYFFSISRTEWVLILLLIGGMIALELLNTAVERVVDLVTLDDHPLAKQAKDLAAGAVLVYAVLSVIAGMFIFLPYVIKFFESL